MGRFAELAREKQMEWAKKPVASEPAGEPNAACVSAPVKRDERSEFHMWGFGGTGRTS